MKYPNFLLILIASLAIMASCKKEKNLQDELAKLPPASQTGANTFGCLVNGKAWVAQNQDCFLLCDPSFKLYYDYGFGGNIHIQAIFKNSKINMDQYIGFGMDSTNSRTSFFYLDFKQHMGFTYKNSHAGTDCKVIKSLYNEIAAYGIITLTRYDLQSGIISGTFEFTLTKPGCDTIKVTNGRFDKKL